jgi:hypothetical protein
LGYGWEAEDMEARFRGFEGGGGEDIALRYVLLQRAMEEEFVDS